MADRATTALVDGLGAAASTSGIITQLQGRIFAFLYLQERPASLDDIAAALEQSKSTISVTIRGLVEWHLVRRVPTPGSRKDFYEAVTNFWRLMQEIMERRFRWNLRSNLTVITYAHHAVAGDATNLCVWHVPFLEYFADNIFLSAPGNDQHSLL